MFCQDFCQPAEYSAITEIVFVTHPVHTHKACPTASEHGAQACGCEVTDRSIIRNCRALCVLPEQAGNSHPVPDVTGGVLMIRSMFVTMHPQTGALVQVRMWHLGKPGERHIRSYQGMRQLGKPTWPLRTVLRILLPGAAMSELCRP